MAENIEFQRMFVKRVFPDYVITQEDSSNMKGEKISDRFQQICV